jgi:hypothetical protein
LHPRAWFMLTVAGAHAMLNCEDSACSMRRTGILKNIAKRHTSAVGAHNPMLITMSKGALNTEPCHRTLNRWVC